MLYDHGKGSNSEGRICAYNQSRGKTNGIFIPFCLGHFIKHKHLISEECYIIFKKGDSNMHQK